MEMDKGGHLGFDLSMTLKRENINSKIINVLELVKKKRYYIRF